MLSLIATLQTLGFQLKNRLENEKGATAVEYGLLVALIAAVLVLVIGNLGTGIQGQFQKMITAL